MNFEQGFYRLRNGDIIKITKENKDDWDEKGNHYADSDFDLIEWLRISENKTHEGKLNE